MKNQHKKSVSLLLVALVSVCVCGTALAQAPDHLGHLDSDVLRPWGVCLKSEDQGNLSANSSPDIDMVDVKLLEGELKLYDAENKELAQLNVAREGDTFGTIVKSDQTDDMGKITYQKSSAQLLRMAEIDGVEIALVPIRVEYTDSTSANDAFDAYINWQSILNIKELTLAYQGWYPAIPEKTPDPLYTEILTKITEADKDVKDVSNETKALSSSLENLTQVSKLEMYQLFGIAASVLLAMILMILWMAYAKKNREKLQALMNFAEVQNRTDQQTSAAVSDIAKHLNEVAKGTAQGNERLAFIAQSLDKIISPKPPVDHIKEFLGQVNGVTTVNAPDQWRQSLMGYRPEFLKYDAIQRWFFREGGIGDPLFAVCSVPSSNESQLCLIPSCYDTMLASGDLPIAYDVIKPMSGESIRTYKIDRVAVLELYGAYFRIVSRGQITLLP